MRRLIKIRVNCEPTQQEKRKAIEYVTLMAKDKASYGTIVSVVENLIWILKG